MAEASGRERRRSASGEVEGPGEDLDAERLLARVIGGALPAVCVVSAVVVGFALGVGPALLVLAFGAFI